VKATKNQMQRTTLLIHKDMLARADDLVVKSESQRRNRSDVLRQAINIGLRSLTKWHGPKPESNGLVVLSYLSSIPGTWRTASRIAAAVGLTEEQVRHELMKLELRGDVERDEDEGIGKIEWAAA